MKSKKVVGVVTTLVMLTQASMTVASILPGGVLSDEQASIVYWPESGELAVDGPVNYSLTSIGRRGARQGGVAHRRPGRTEVGRASQCDGVFSLEKQSGASTFGQCQIRVGIE